MSKLPRNFKVKEAGKKLSQNCFYEKLKISK